MPIAVPVTFRKYFELEQKLKALGFVEIPWWETATILEPRGVDPQRVFVRGEIGFELAIKGHKVRVWTSCIRREVERCRRHNLLNEIVSRAPKRDAGYVLITDFAGRAHYFAGRTSRTKNFVRTLLRRAWIAQYKIQNRPACRICGAAMDICSRSDTGGNFWGCFQKGSHPDGKPVWEEWDFGLPPNAKRIAVAWRKERARYYEARRRQAEFEERVANAVVRAGV